MSRRSISVDGRGSPYERAATPHARACRVVPFMGGGGNAVATHVPMEDDSLDAASPAQLRMIHIGSPVDAQSQGGTAQMQGSVLVPPEIMC